MKNSNKYKIIHLIFFKKKTLLKKLPKNQPLKLTRLRYLISVFLLSHDFFFCLFIILRQGLILHPRRPGTHCVVQAHFALMVILLPQLQSARISGVNTQAHVPNSCFAWTWLVVGTNHQVFFFFLLFFFSLFFSPLFSLCSLSFPPFSLICLFLFFLSSSCPHLFSVLLPRLALNSWIQAVLPLNYQNFRLRPPLLVSFLHYSSENSPS